ncbi:MAG: hypothetical protein GX974_05025, partial [Clostridiales bacterium]|nr:hypothetical protein [Clostridiales bacterium]
MRSQTQYHIPRRRLKYSINWRRFIPFILTIVAVIIVILYIINPNMFSNKYKVSDIDPTHLEIYFMAAEDQKVPWVYLAAIDKAEKAQDSEITHERSSNIGIYLKDIQSIEELPDMLESYNNDKKFLSRLKKEVKKFRYLDEIYENKVFPIVLDNAYTYEDGYGDGRSYGGDRKH